MTIYLDHNDSLKLFNVLDEEIGLYKTGNKEQDLKAQRFIDDMKKEFCEEFQKNVPMEKWVQGEQAGSAWLLFDSIEGFRVLINDDSRHAKEIESRVNQRLKNINVECKSTLM